MVQINVFLHYLHSVCFFRLSYVLQRLFTAKYVLDCTILVPVSVSIIIYPRRISLRLSCSSMHCLFLNAVLIFHFVFWKGLARELIRLKDSILVQITVLSSLSKTLTGALFVSLTIAGLF